VEGSNGSSSNRLHHLGRIFATRAFTTWHCHTYQITVYVQLPSNFTCKTILKQTYITNDYLDKVGKQTYTTNGDFNLQIVTSGVRKEIYSAQYYPRVPFFLEFKISYVDFITSYMSIHFSMSGLIDANGPVKVTLNF
jgi:hypothetical protein